VTGAEVPYADLQDVAGRLGWRAARRHVYPTIAAMVADCAVLPATEEGYVAQFPSGVRLKVKGSEYRRIHSLASACTPLAIWQALADGADMEALRREIPEEFWTDFDVIVRLLREQVATYEKRIERLAGLMATFTDKQLALALPTDVRGFVFAWRRSGALTGKSLSSIWRSVRPTGNQLPGYTASHEMSSIPADAAYPVAGAGLCPVDDGRYQSGRRPRCHRPQAPRLCAIFAPAETGQCHGVPFEVDLTFEPHLAEPLTQSHRLALVTPILNVDA
jgi:RNA ligase